MSFYKSGNDYSFTEVSDGVRCPYCGTKMNLMETNEGYWLNHCPRCGHTERRR